MPLIDLLTPCEVDSCPEMMLAYEACFSARYNDLVKLHAKWRWNCAVVPCFDPDAFTTARMLLVGLVRGVASRIHFTVRLGMAGAEAVGAPIPGRTRLHLLEENIDATTMEFPGAGLAEKSG